VSARVLGPEGLARRYDPGTLGFLTTAELADVTELIGQPRATAAIDVGLGMTRNGNHLFAMGPNGTGKRTYVTNVLRARAGARPTPSDLCYVHDFDAPQAPRLLVVPAGMGVALQSDVEQLVEDLRAAIAAAFESEGYHARREALEREVKAQPQQAFEALDERAKQERLALVRTPLGVMVAPQRDGEVLSAEEVAALPEAERAAVQAKIEAFEQDVQRTMRQAPRWLRTRRERLAQLRRETTTIAVEHLMDETRRKYAAVPDVADYMDAVQRDVIEHAAELVEGDRPAEGPAELLAPALARSRRARYRVNVIVDNGRLHGAPVVIEDNPTYENLVGRIEHTSEFGTLVTDFSHIRAGALHRANGGYLVLEAHRLLASPYSWEALKRALQSGTVRIEPLGRALGLLGTVSLEPQAVPLEVQVVLLGEPLLYYLLSVVDPDFGELFRIMADFADDMPATDADRRPYAALLATVARQHGLRRFDRHAIARLFEHSARLAGHQERLSLRFGRLLDLMREADYWAGRAGADTVGLPHVQQALDAQVRRSDRLRQRILDEMVDGTVVVDTAGTRVGQVNSLSVTPLGDFVFGRPSRITARVRMGQAGVVDIEREVELGGPIHSKGVLILSGYLGERYAPAAPLSLSATLVFEQSYAAVEGDSASAAELFALLSAIAGTPLRQDLAVTGAVDQHGRIEAVGSVNEKVEGFFDLCRARGLTGEHGVIIPAANARHLMLRPDVIEAVAAGRFRVYTMETADEGLEILTGLPAGERDPTGEYPEGSVNRLVDERLVAFAETWRAAAVPAGTFSGVDGR
jgi:predicted ATP-dependent protease